ncbi:YdcF family protein [[Phormidium] sp. ETS-05]|uniref:YdcF family protein n=1 Tax=[Phormidium] sp. ETS-05 TaxID=222819 RepID=UPI0018EECB7A|nr:YdcF family protein [[Phormidium] sp. ETS-05]
MNILSSKRKKQRFFLWASSTFLLLLVSFIPVRLMVAYHQAPLPQAILTLGGGIDREKFTAEFAQNHPKLDIWVSSGIPPLNAGAIFAAADIPEQRVYLDYDAVDTVTNFTTMVADFRRRNIQHVYLITSDFHMPRAKAIAYIVFGSQGIAFTPITVPSNRPPESSLRIARDAGRSLLWLVTGRTGASLNPRYSALTTRREQG